MYNAEEIFVIYLLCLGLLKRGRMPLPEKSTMNLILKLKLRNCQGRRKMTGKTVQTYFKYTSFVSTTTLISAIEHLLEEPLLPKLQFQAN